MGSKRKAEPPEIIVKQFTAQEIEIGIKKLLRRIDDLKGLEQTPIARNNQLVHNLEVSIRETIREIYGPQSPEFHDHQHHRIWDGHLYGGMGNHEFQQGIRAGIPKTCTMIEGLISRLKEKQLDFVEDPGSQVRASFRGMQLHPGIASVATRLFEDGHYADSVFNASKVLVNYVKEKAGEFELDGAALMRTVFSKNDPILAFNDLKDTTDSDEQEGMMHLFEGAVLAIRNPRGHAVKFDSPERALDYIFLLNLLANRLEETKKRR